MSPSPPQKLIITLFILILTSIFFTNLSTSNSKEIEGIFNVISGDTISLNGVVYKLEGIKDLTPARNARKDRYPGFVAQQQNDSCPRLPMASYLHVKQREQDQLNAISGVETWL